MIKIHKINDNLLKKKLSEKYIIEYNEDKIYLGVFEKENLLEFAVYKIENELSVVEFISNLTAEFSLIHGLMKTLIYLSDISRVKTITLPLEYTRIAKALAFSQNQNNYTLNIEEYVNTCSLI